MDEVAVMHVFNRHESLVEEFKCLDLAESFIFVQIIKEIAVFCIFQHYIHFLFLLKDLIKFYNIGMF